MSLPNPPEGYANVGCPTCGRLMTLPMDPGDIDDRPWCVHHDSNYSWRAPHDPESDWTRMVLVTKVIAPSGKPDPQCPATANVGRKRCRLPGGHKGGHRFSTRPALTPAELMQQETCTPALAGIGGPDHVAKRG